MSKSPDHLLPGERVHHQYRWGDRVIDLVFEHKDGSVRILEMKGGAGMTAAARRHMVRALLLGNTSDHPVRDDLMMPQIGLKLLPFLLPRKLRDAVAGDLAEDFSTYAARWGRPYALRWVWWELAGLAVRRFGPAGIVTAVAMWFRQKLGW